MRIRTHSIRGHMGRINVVLSNETEHKLRKALVDNPDYGGRKGDLSEAIEQAILEWLSHEEEGTVRKTRK
jgi:hypothetical protein